MAKTVIKSILFSIIFSLIIGTTVWLVSVSIIYYLFDLKFQSDTNLTIILTLSILMYPFLVFGIFSVYKEESRCPKCKEAFCLRKKKLSSKTVSQSYLGKAQGKGHMVGKRMISYEITCKHCGYKSLEDTMKFYKERI